MSGCWNKAAYFKHNCWFTESKPSYDVLNAIATSDLNLNTDWLITGRGSMTKDDSTTEPFAILQKYDAEVEIKNEIITIKRKHK